MGLKHDPMDIRSLLLRMGSRARTLVLGRAFPDDGSPGRGVRGRRFKTLDPDYEAYKSGTRAYVSPESAAKAKAKRAESGKPGPGPLVNVLGIRTRLGRRLPVSNQRLTDGTAKALGVVRATDKTVTLGFRDARAQQVAGHLEARNRFWGLDESEREELIRMAEAEFGEMVASVRIDPRKLTLRFTL